MAGASIGFRPRKTTPPPTVPSSSPAGAVSHLRVGGMDCGSCAQKVTRALTGVVGVDSAEVDLAAGTASVRWRKGVPADLPHLITAVQQAGYEAHPSENAGASVIRLKIDGMTCQNCAQQVQKALAGVPGVASAVVELSTGMASVRADGTTRLDPSALIVAVKQAGYEASPVAEASASEKPKPDSAWRTAIWLGAPVTLALMMAEWAFGLGMNRTYHWVAFALALPVQVLVGGRFYRGAWRQLRVGQSNMDTLVSLGSTAAFGFSLWALLTRFPGHLYFMESAGILTLISTGHWLEARMSTRAGQSLRALLNLAPQRARLLRDGGETEVPVSELQPGNRIALRPGDRVPVDAEILEGESVVDEAMLTGEPVPVEKQAGAKLFTGTVNQSGRLVARVTATGEATALAHIIAAVQRAQSSRANVQRLADRISSVFVPVVVALALAAAAWWGFGYESARATHDALGAWLWHAHVPDSPLAAALMIFAAILIVACPCAMGLATPTALMAGVNAAARRGILIRDAGALEKSGRVTTVVFDKTGTLTQGHPAVVAHADFRPPEARPVRLESLAISLAASSQHPLSRAIAQLGQGMPADELTSLEIRNWKEHRGSGLEGLIAAGSPPEVLRLGSVNWFRELKFNLDSAASFLAEQGAHGATVLLLTLGDRLVGAFALRDPLRANAREIISQLRQGGLQVRLLTGDQRAAAEAVARELDLPAEAVAAEVRPEQKAAVIADFQQRGERVAFVGDGLNDGPALAQADLGIAVTQATDVAKEAADILLLKSDLAAIPEALGLAQATLRVIHQNLFWAFFYNAAFVPLAALGFLSPILSAVAMGLSDLIVIGNALRLGRQGMTRGQ